MRRIVVGSRGSQLALRQTDEVVGRLREARPETDFEVVTIRTGGDAAPEAPLVGIGRGVFVKEIESALSDGRIDLAVHSLKDMTTILPLGLTIGAVCRRADPRDALVDRWGCPVSVLRPGSRIGTSSPRRAVQLKEARPDIEALPIRGSVETRLAKGEGDDYDGVILAVAGLQRLGLEYRISEALSPKQFVPAPGQGALAVETREKDEEVLGLLACLEDTPTRQAVTAERAFLEALGGGCQAPAGAYGQVEGDLLTLTVFLATADGSVVLRAEVTGSASDPHQVGVDAYSKLVDQGAKAILVS